MLSEETTYGASAPSVTALDEHTFAGTWAGSPQTRDLDYNEHIYCRLFFLDDDGAAPTLLHTTLTVNQRTERRQRQAQIVALSNHDNQVTDSKRFVISWHAEDLDGAFNAIYFKLLSWDYESATSVVIEGNAAEESQVKQLSRSILGHVVVSRRPCSICRSS